jgi:hypothetical protein
VQYRETAILPIMVYTKQVYIKQVYLNMFQANQIRTGSAHSPLATGSRPPMTGG